jgi:Zn-dependent protease with chaperone function
MNIAVCVLLYGAALTWLGPPMLARLTSTGASPRLALTVWLTAMALVGLAWIVTGAGLLLEILGIHIAKPERFCVDMALGAGHLGWAGGAALDAVTAAASAVTIIVVLRVFLAAYRFWQRSREHAHTARLLGAPAYWAETVVVTSPVATAYCVAGRPDAIVVTTGALAALSDAELAAVLTHEQAHLRGRHPQLLILFRALATSMPRLPLFTRGFEHVGRLLEMRADDIAAQRHGRQALLGGLLRLAGAFPAGATAVGAAETAVLERVARLVAPAGVRAQLPERIALTATLVALTVAPIVITMICHR